MDTNNNIWKFPSYIHNKMKQLLYFGADWCAPCNAIKPQLQTSGLPITYINVDSSPETAKTWNVRNIPTLLIIKNAMEEGRLTGPSITVSAATQMFNK